MQNELIPLQSMGVSEAQIGLLASHLAKAAEFMWPTDLGIPEALKWMHESFVKHLSPHDADLLSNVIIKNLPSTEVAYNEVGYDSCQSTENSQKLPGSYFGRRNDLRESTSRFTHKLRRSKSPNQFATGSESG